MHMKPTSSEQCRAHENRKNIVWERTCEPLFLHEFLTHTETSQLL